MGFLNPRAQQRARRANLRAKHDRQREAIMAALGVSTPEEALDRCRATLDRHRAIRESWTAAERAQARQAIRARHGAILFDPAARAILVVRRPDRDAPAGAVEITTRSDLERSLASARSLRLIAMHGSRHYLSPGELAIYARPMLSEAAA